MRGVFSVKDTHTGPPSLFEDLISRERNHQNPSARFGIDTPINPLAFFGVYIAVLPGCNNMLAGDVRGAV